MTTFFKQIVNSECNSFSVVIEDDGRVCYGYLLQDRNVIGDIWLYNQSPTPQDTQWDKRDMPFLNPAEFVKDNLIARPIISDKDVRVEWLFLTGACILDQVRIFVRDELTAIIKPGAKPGWSILVKKDGPLAKFLS